MFAVLIGFIVYVAVAIVVAILLEIPPKLALTLFAIGVWWLFF